MVDIDEPCEGTKKQVHETMVDAHEGSVGGVTAVSGIRIKLG